MTRWLMERKTFWTRTNVFILAVGVEHLVIGLKLVIALLIPDVPQRVKRAEEKRGDATKYALRELERTKKDSGARDIEEII